MNGLEWLLVLGVVCGMGYILLVRRLGMTNPYNSINHETAADAHEGADGLSGQRQHSPEAQGSRAHGGCCGITR